MDIINRSMIIIDFTKDEKNIVNGLHKCDIIMYRGDTYKIYAIIAHDDGYTVKLEMIFRAVNFYCINMDNKLFKVADFDFNCRRENIL